MKLRSFFKGLLAAPLVIPKVIIGADKPNRIMIRVLEMGTLYGTPILVFILPDGKRLVFVGVGPSSDPTHPLLQRQWDRYRGDWRDLELYAWTGGDFPDYKTLETEVRFRHDYEP